MSTTGHEKWVFQDHLQEVWMSLAALKFFAKASLKQAY